MMYFVAPTGFEPIPSDPGSDILPIYYGAIYFLYNIRNRYGIFDQSTIVITQLQFS